VKKLNLKLFNCYDKKKYIYSFLNLTTKIN